MHVNDGNDINHGPPKGEPDVARIRCIQCHRVDKTLDAPNQNNVRCSLLWAQDIGSLTYFQQRIQQQCGVVSTFLGVREMTTPFVACMDYSPESHCIDKIHVCPKIRIVGKLTCKVASRNLACIVVCIGANQKNQPNLDLYLVRGFTICHFPIVVSYLCIGQSQKNQPNLVLYLVRRSKIFVSVATLPLTMAPVSNLCYQNVDKGHPNQVQPKPGPRRGRPGGRGCL